jgi:predicted amidophosphoribosyltransferase
MKCKGGQTMGCNCGKRNPKNQVKCVGCGKVTTKNSAEFKRYWMRCPECASASKFACGRCLVKKGYKVPGLGKKKTAKYNDILKVTLEEAKLEKQRKE